MKSQIARLGSRDVEYLHLTGKSVTVVLVNGSGGPLISWLGVMEEISDDYNVLAYNRPGVGRSSAGTSPQTASQMAEDLHELMALLEIGGVVVLVGHSLGGLVVLQFCLSFPHRAKGIVLLEPSTVWDIDNQKSLPRDTKDPNSELNHVKGSAELLRDLSMFPNVLAAVGIGVKSSLLYRMFRRSFDERRNNLRRLALAIPNSRVVEFKKSGHFPQMSEPKRVAELIRQVGEDLTSVSK